MALRPPEPAGLPWYRGRDGDRFAYFIINAAVQSYASSGVCPPFVAAWVPLIFVLSGICFP